MSQSQEIRLQQLQNWKQSVELRKILQEQGIDQQQDYLAQLTYKIAEKAFGKGNKQNIENKVCEMVEQQTCAVCFELMIPPQYSPILLFPCGHTFCKQCTLENGKLKLSKCCLCRAKITANAINLGLQNLICVFSEQKQQQQQVQQPVVEIAKQQQNLPENEYSNQYRMYKLRCDILMQEKQNLIKQTSDLQKQLEKEELQVGFIQSERDQIKVKQQELQNQLENFNELLADSLNNVEEVNRKLDQVNQQIQILEKTLKPLQGEMNKYQLLSQQ